MHPAPPDLEAAVERCHKLIDIEEDGPAPLLDLPRRDDLAAVLSALTSAQERAEKWKSRYFWMRDRREYAKEREARGDKMFAEMLARAMSAEAKEAEARAEVERLQGAAARLVGLWDRAYEERIPWPPSPNRADERVAEQYDAEEEAMASLRAALTESPPPSQEDADYLSPHWRRVPLHDPAPPSHPDTAEEDR